MFHPKQFCHSADLYLQIKGFAFQSNYSPQTPKWGTEGIVTFSTPWCSHGCFPPFCAPKFLLITLMVICYFCPASGAQDTLGGQERVRGFGP